MITDLFTSNNQGLSQVAFLSSINAGIKTQDLQSARIDKGSTGSVDFAGILSQTMSSHLSEIGKGSSLSISIPKPSYKAESLTPSSLAGSNQRNSFQSSFELGNKSLSTPANECIKASKNKPNTSIEKKVGDEESYVSKKEDDVEAENNCGQQGYEEEKTEESLSLEAKACLALEKEVLEDNQGLEDLTLSEETPAKEEVAEIEAAETEETAENEETAQPEALLQNIQSVELNEKEKEVKVGSTEEATQENKLSETKISEETAEKDKLSKDDEESKTEAAESHKLANVMEGHIVSESGIELVSQNKGESLRDDSNHEAAKNLNLPKESKLDAKENLADEETSEALELDKNEKADKEKSAKTEDKSNGKTKFDETVKSLEAKKEAIPEESLRKEFARVTNQEDKVNGDNSDLGLNYQGIDTPDQALQTAATVTDRAVENLNRIFTELIGKSEGNSDKNNTNRIATGNLEGIAKGFNQNHNSSGMNSGFSFQSGNTSTYNAKGEISQNQNTATASFSELLTKAEMVKTKDGAKVMNIEVEQEGLGKLELELTSKDGKVIARLSAESELAKTKLEELTPQIKENLIEKGVNLTQISVDISSKDADGNGNQYQNSGKKNKSKGLDSIKNRSVKEIIEKSILPNLRRKALNIQSVDIKV